jgi:kinesin family protein C2/C3
MIFVAEQSLMICFVSCLLRSYGQTGSGKTFTMEGVPEGNQYGISYRTIQKIFHLLKLRDQQQRAAELFVGNESDPAESVDFHFTMEVGMLEIYNEEIFDLLATSGSSVAEKKKEAKKAGGKASLEIRRSKDGHVEVPNLTKEKVNGIKEVMELLKRGNSNRATASTDVNEHSSRSHMVLMVEVTSGVGDVDSNKGTLYLVDLAGSERNKKSNAAGETLKEAGFINKSLSALGNVMEALDRKSPHVPYRDSKLTYLLQNALGGNSRTMMVVTTCPTDGSYDESVNALQFATRVRRIQIGAAQRNVTSKNLEETVKTLTEEMRSLTRAKERTESQLHSLKRDNARVQDKLQNLSKSRAQSRSDSKTLEVLKKNNEDMAERWRKEKEAREETAEDLDKARKENRTLQQQLSKHRSMLQLLEQRLEDKENALERASQQLRSERNQKTAASVRSRRDEVLGSRLHQPSPRYLSRASASTSKSFASASRSTFAETTASGDSDETDVAEIRSQVLALLEKYDKAKVDRIDVIMDKFEGKEALLLEKMTQRYEGPAASASIQKRNEMALQRHHDRMKKIHEKKMQDKQNGI